MLLIIGLGSSWWGLFSKRWSSGIVNRANTVEHRVLAAAKALQGKLTPATIALEAGLSLDDAQAALDGMVSHGVAETWVSDAGHLVYVFRAFTDPGDRFTAKDPLRDELSEDIAEVASQAAEQVQR